MSKLSVPFIAASLLTALSWQAGAQVVYQGPGVYSTTGNQTIGPGGTQLNYGNQTQSGTYSNLRGQTLGPSGSTLSSFAGAASAGSGSSARGVTGSQDMTSAQGMTSTQGMTSPQGMTSQTGRTQAYVTNTNGQSHSCSTSGNTTYCN